MSMFSNKCDCADHFWMGANNDEDIQKEIDRTDFYIWGEGGRRFRLDIHTVKDLVPYYPFLIAVGAWSKEGRCTIIFSDESFVDKEEKEFIGWELRDALAEYKKCKRKKIPFDVDAYLEKRKGTWRMHNYTEEVVRRVATNGLKANIDGLHSNFKDKYERARLAQEMQKYGYTDGEINMWVFGLRKEYPNWKEEESE